MYKVGEGVRGVDVIAVFNGASEMKEFIKKNSLTERGKYILLEVSSIGETVRDVLNNLGMNGSFLESDYLHDAIELALNDDAYINLITKVTYPELAKKYNVSCSCIERAIRTAIENTWKNGNLEYRKKIFGESGEEGCTRPSNMNYIKAIVQYLK